MVSGERPFVSYSQLTPGKTGSAKTDEIAPTNQMSRNPMTLRTRRVDRVFIDVDFSLPFDSYRNNWSRILWPNMLLYDNPCTVACTTDFSISLLYHKFMKSDLRISIKDYLRNKNLKILLERAFSSHRQFYVSMNGSPWPKDGRPVSLTKLLTAIRKALVKSS